MKRVNLNPVLLAGALAVWAGLAGGADNPSWTYLPDAGVISNSGWTLNVAVRDAGRRTLSLGTPGKPGSAFRKKDGTVIGTETLDLSCPIADAAGQAWTVEGIGNDVLSDAASPLKTFVAPRELREIGAGNFNYARSTGLDITLDCPYLEGALPNGFVGGEASSRLRLSVPNCPKLDSYALTSAGPQAGAKWDLGGVRELDKLAIPWIATPETLQFPRLEKMAGGAITGGQKIGNLLTLGDGFNTFLFADEKAWNPDWSHPIEKVVIGCAPGCVFKRYALNTAGLRRVWMTGAVPVFDAAEGDPVFGSREYGQDGTTVYGHAATNSIVFYVPSNRVWRAVCAKATPLTEAETAAFREAHPDWDVPFGVVAPEVFRTKNPQYIGYVDETKLPRYVQVTTFAHRRYGNTWTVKDTYTLAYADVEKEVPYGAVVEVPHGVQITLTAGTAGDGAPVPVWEGLPDGTTASPAGTASFAVTESAALYVHFPGDWTPKEDGKKLTDGYWTLSVEKGGDDLKLLSLGEDSKTLEGELDLSGSQITVLPDWNNAFEGAQFASFYAPRSLAYLGRQVFRNRSGRNLVLDCPNLTNAISRSWGFFAAWPRTVLKLPNAPKIEDAAGIGMTFADTDLADWDLGGLKEVGAEGLTAVDAGPGPRGELTLPDVETLGDRAFANWRRVTSAALGTNGTLKTVGDCLFAGNTNALKKVDFGRSSAFTLAEKAFYTGTNALDRPIALDEIWFSGNAPGTAVLDTLVAGRTVSSDAAGASEDLKIFAPLAKPSWRPVTTQIPRELLAAGKALKRMLDADAENGREYRVVGVYRTQDGVARAWLVQNPAFEYRNGFVLHFR